MPREKEGFHEQLEAIYEHFGKEPALVPLNKVAEYLGVDKRTLLDDESFPIKTFGRQCYRVPLVSLARWLA